MAHCLLSPCLLCWQDIHYSEHKGLRERLELQGAKQEAEIAEKAQSPEKSPSADAEQQNKSSSSTTATALAESQKGPRRRNRAERAALQEEQKELEHEQARRKWWWVTGIAVHWCKIGCWPLPLVFQISPAAAG